MTLRLGIATTIGLLLFNGCGGGSTPDDNIENIGESSEVSIEYGLYGSNKDLGSEDHIRITWIKKSSVESPLIITSDVDTSTDGYLSSLYGSPHYHYDIDKASDIGTYIINCSVAVESEEWVRYTCLREGMFLDEQDSSIDNSFVIKYTGENRVSDSDPTGTGSETLGWLSYPL